MEMFLAVLLSVVATDAAAVANPGFEELSEQSGLPSGWWFTSLPNQARLVRYETVAAGEDQESRALAIKVASDHPEQRVAYNAHQILPGIVPGKTYRVSAKVQTKGLSHLPFVAVQCLDETKTKYLTISSSPERTLTGDIEKWERVETEITVPEETKIVWLRIGIWSKGNTGGTALIDDVEVAQVQ
jgi:hypothetical protein